MAITVIRGRENWNSRTVTVPYTVQNEEADGRLYGVAAEQAVGTRCLLDWGVTTNDYDGDRASDHAVEYTLRLDRQQVNDYESYLSGGGGGGYTPAVTYETEVRVFPPEPQYRSTALAIVQKHANSGTPPDTFYLDPVNGAPQLIEPPAESDRIEATFPTTALAESFRSAMRACMHRTNDDEWHGHDAGTAMIVRAGAVATIGGLARVSIGLAIGEKRTVTRESATLTNVLPFSRVTEVRETTTQEFLGVTVQTGGAIALYEHRVFEEADYDQLNIPYVAPA